MKKMLIGLFFVFGSPNLMAQTWIHYQIEYIHAIPQTETVYDGTMTDDIRQGVEAEVFHNVKFLPNVKFDMLQNGDLKMSNKILYYSSYMDSFHLDFGGGFRNVRYKGGEFDYKYIMGRVKTNVINNVYGSLTYNYELEGKVKEYLVDVNYRLSDSFPMTLGFQYKSSEMLIPNLHKTEGLYLKVGFLF